MASGHDEIKEELPRYIKEGLLPDEVKEHLEACSECSEDGYLLKAINRCHVPEPGGMFFETLPQKVRASVHIKKRNIFFRFTPVFALIVLVIAGSYIYHFAGISETDGLYVFSDPLSQPVYNLSALNPEDVPFNEIIEEDGIFLDESNFLMEFVSLNADEIEGLFEALEKNGGVL